MVAEDERNRALEFRRMMQAREDARLANEKRLAGSATAYNELLEKTSALRDWVGWNPKVRVQGDAE